MYIVKHPDHPPFTTHWFDHQNHYTEGSTVINLDTMSYYDPDKNMWVEMFEDHL